VDYAFDGSNRRHSVLSLALMGRRWGYGTERTSSSPDGPTPLPDERCNAPGGNRRGIGTVWNGAESTGDAAAFASGGPSGAMLARAMVIKQAFVRVRCSKRRAKGTIWDLTGQDHGDKTSVRSRSLLLKTSSEPM
jgi:hypothetical protein